MDTTPNLNLYTQVSPTAIRCPICNHDAMLADFIITLSNHRRVSVRLSICVDDEHGCKTVTIDNYQWDETWDELRETLRAILKGFTP